MLVVLGLHWVWAPTERYSNGLCRQGCCSQQAMCPAVITAGVALIGLLFDGAVVGALGKFVQLSVGVAVQDALSLYIASAALTTCHRLFADLYCVVACVRSCVQTAVQGSPFCAAPIVVAAFSLPFALIRGPYGWNGRL